MDMRDPTDGAAAELIRAARDIPAGLGTGTCTTCPPL